MKYILLLFTALFIIPSFHPIYALLAPCPPFYTKIDYIENNRECLSVREFNCSTGIDILNHCDDEFNYYNPDGSLNTQEVIINYDDYVVDEDKFYKIEKETGIKQTAVWLPKINFSLYDCKNNPQIINNMNVCDSKALEKLKDDTPIISWTLTLKSVKNGEDIKIYGRTLYRNFEKNTVGYFITPLLKIISLVSIISFSILILLLVMRFIMKKKVSSILILFLIILSLITYFLNLISRFSF